jgi:hypothetical protein
MRKQQDIDRYYAETGASAAAEADAQRRNQRAIEAALNGQVRGNAPAYAEETPVRPRYDEAGYGDDGYAYYPPEAPAPRKHMSVRKAAWLARIAVLIVFILNVMCAIQFIADPMRNAAAYGLPATQESAAMVAGLGVAFLMWNVTYPAVICSPRRFRALYVVVLIQQLVGLVGESFIWWRLIDAGLGSGLMAAGIMRFVVFDAGGLIIMLAAFIVLSAAIRRATV